MNFAFLYGSRPEIIKLAPLIKYCFIKKINFFSINSGQHYSDYMNEEFIKNFKLSKPKYKLKIKSKSPLLQGLHTAAMLKEIEKILILEKPQVLFIHGDTNTALAGALAARKISTTSFISNINIKIAHIESGLRSFDKKMPEEINRIICDHLSDYLFVPTIYQKKNLLKEGIDKKKLFTFGNTITESIKYANKYIKNYYKPSTEIVNLSQGNFFILTLHRQETVDNKKVLNNIFKGLKNYYKINNKIIMYYCMHPRSFKMIKKNKIKIPNFINIIKPLNYFDFIYIISRSKLVLTDSGGLQEESSILGIPCVTLRTTTERPETIISGSNAITGQDPGNIVKIINKMYGKKNWKTPYNHQKISEKIISNIINNKNQN